MKELTSAINEAAENAEWGDLSLDEMKQYILMLSLQGHPDIDTRARAARLLEEDRELTFSQIMDDLDHFESVKKDLYSSERKHINEVQDLTSKQPNHQRNPQEAGTSKSTYKGQYVCYRCNKPDHRAEQCKYKNFQCKNCSKIGHLTSACRSKPIQQGDKNRRNPNRQVSAVADRNTRVTKMVNINGMPARLTMDTGAEVTLISARIWETLGKPTLRAPSVSLTVADGRSLKVIGTLDCEAEFNGNKFHGECHVTEKCELLGLDWMKKDPLMKKFLQSDEKSSILQVKVLTPDENFSPLADKRKKLMEECIEKFPDVFSKGLGKCRNYEAEITLKHNVKPTFRKARPVAYALLPKVVEELERMVRENVLEPIVHSTFATPVVVVKKKNGTIRMCADYSTGLNDSIEDDVYPLPTAEDIFSTLSGGKFFSQIDLSEAYLQVPMKRASQNILTINTVKGLFAVKRLPFGIKTAPSQFQRLMDMVTANLPGTVAYLDDILIKSENIKEHEQRLTKLMERLQTFGLKVRAEKCEFLKEEVKFLGFILNKEGRKPDPEKTKAIADMPSPTNVSELKSLLGMITFYSQFIPDLKTLKDPLNELLKKEQKFIWTERCEINFQKLKETLLSDLLLTHFNPNLPIVVSADASQNGIGGTLQHVFPDGKQRAVMHISRSLTDTERRYSQIVKEALALVYAVRKFHKYIYGRQFILNTDHKPLVTIFGSKTGISGHAANRLQRWAVILLDYQFKIQYRRTTDFGEADALSRLIKEHQIETKEEISDKVIASVEADFQDDMETDIKFLPVTKEEIQNETRKDYVMSETIKYIESKWPKINRDDPTFQLYSRRENLSIIDDILMYNNRVVIPKALQKRILETLHEGHPGQTRMTMLARSYVYWSNIDKDIVNFVRLCEDCQLASKNPRKIPLQPWPRPDGPWKRIHADFAGPLKNTYYLIVVDSFSNWPEVMPMKKITTTATIERFEDLFIRNGLPDEIMTDNGTQFTSHDFTEFCRNYGIKKTFSAPHYPMSNGRAERMVDIFKRSLKKMASDTTTDQAMKRFLKTYRTTPSEALGGKTPAELFTGRKFKTSLDTIIPTKKIASVEILNYRKRTRKNFDRHHGVKKETYEENEPVYVKMHQRNQEFWTRGTVKTHNNALYDVEVENKSMKRHSNQLRRRYSSDTRDPNGIRNSLSNGIQLAYDLPLPSEKKAFRRGKEDQMVKKELTPKRSPNFVPKMETLLERLQTVDRTIKNNPQGVPALQDELMRSIQELEEEAADFDDAELAEVVEKTHELVGIMQLTDQRHAEYQRSHENIDETELSELVQSMNLESTDGDKQVDGPMGLANQLLNNKSIAEEIGAAVVSSYSQGASQESLREEKLTADQQKYVVKDSIRRQLFQETRETRNDSDSSAEIEPYNAELEEAQTHDKHTARTNITEPNALEGEASATVGTSLSHTVPEPLGGGTTSEGVEEEPTNIMEVSIFENQPAVSFDISEMEIVQFSPRRHPQRIRKQPSYLDVTHTNSPRYKSLKRN